MSMFGNIYNVSKVVCFKSGPANIKRTLRIIHEVNCHWRMNLFSKRLTYAMIKYIVINCFVNTGMMETSKC